MRPAQKYKPERNYVGLRYIYMVSYFLFFSQSFVSDFERLHIKMILLYTSFQCGVEVN